MTPLTNQWIPKNQGRVGCIGFWGGGWGANKWNIACHIGKQRMSQSSAITALQRDLVSSKGTQEGKNTCHLAAIRLQPLPTMSPEEIQDVKTQDTGPR